jgi:uncharacterized membrane protein
MGYGKFSIRPAFCALQGELRHIDRLSGFFLVVWLLSMISVPIQQWAWGEEAVLRGTVIGVLLQATTVSVILLRIWPARRALTLGLGIAIFAWAIEWIGSSTGVPFGSYHYTDRLQPQLLGVPLLIPLAWLMMVPPAWGIGGRLVRSGPRWQFVAVSAAAFTAWDFFLDPQMVHWRLWVWDEPGGYFGIPWANFAGWFVAADLLTVLLRPEPTSDARLVWVYTLTWGLEAMALILFWGLPGPGLVGLVIMGAFVVMAWRGGNGRCL